MEQDNQKDASRPTPCRGQSAREGSQRSVKVSGTVRKVLASFERSLWIVPEGFVDSGPGGIFSPEGPRDLDESLS